MMNTGAPPFQTHKHIRMPLLSTVWCGFSQKDLKDVFIVLFAVKFDIFRKQLSI